MTDFFGRFAATWAINGQPQPPTDAQAAQGLTFLGQTPPAAQLHDAMFQWLDQKDTYLFAQIASIFTTLAATINETAPGALGPLLAQTYAPLASPAFTGQPTTTLPPSNSNDASIPNTAWIVEQIAVEIAARQAAVTQLYNELVAAVAPLVNQNQFAGNFSPRGSVSIRKDPSGQITQRFPTPILNYNANPFSLESYPIVFPEPFPNGVMDIFANDGGFSGILFSSFGTITKTGCTGFYQCAQPTVTGAQGAITVVGW